MDTGEGIIPTLITLLAPVVSAITLLAPPSLTAEASLSLCAHIGALNELDEFIVDFRQTTNVEPFGMLMVSSELRELKRRYPRADLRARNFHRMTYAAHMGFFRAFGLDFGKNPGEAPGNSRYLPITFLDCAEIERQAAERHVVVQEEIERQSERLSQILCGSNEGPLFETLSYSFREITRNVAEHSGSAQVEICAQARQNRIEVAIVDRGIGIRQSIQNNPHIDASTHKKAINYALMPAVSGKAFKGSKVRQKGEWVNSGFGLYMTNRICRNGGNFLIASGDTAMLLTSRGEGKRYFDCSLQGTAVRMTIRTKEIPNLHSALETYRADGYEIQKKYAEIVRIDPSAASLMLSRDFDVTLVNRLLATLKG